MIVYVASYPRSGNSLFMNLIRHHLRLPVYSMYQEPAHLDMTRLTADDLIKLETRTEVFFVKTHELPNSQYPAIYLVRDGRDVIISYAHYMIANHINLPDLPGEKMFEWALNSLIMSPDQFEGWSQHVLAWIQRSEKTIVIRFEELVQPQNQLQILKTAVRDLGLGDLKVQDSSALTDFSSFQGQNADFYRKGTTGSWITEMSVEHHVRFWEQHGTAMKKLGYGENIAEITLRLELGIAEVMRSLQQEKQRMAHLESRLQSIKSSNELFEKEEVIRNFRESFRYSMIHGPFRRIPLFSPIARASQWFTPQLGKLIQHEPREADIPATYFKTEKLSEPALTISIVTPTYNYAHFLERTMKSVISQNYPSLEYIIQDGGSVDGTVELVQNFRNHLKHFESRKDNGQAHAINLGFQYASGEIMAYLNSDDVLLPGTLNYVANYFSKHPKVDVIYGHRLIIDEDDHVIGEWTMPPHDPETLRWADYIPQETVFWRRSLWEKTGGYLDESFQFALDWDLLLRFQNAGGVFHRLPRYLAAFRIHVLQKTSAQIFDLGEQEANRIRISNFGRQVTHEEINNNIRAFLLRSIWHRWLHKLKINTDKFLARVKSRRQTISWYDEPVWPDRYIIPLGLNCDVAHFLRKNGLRKSAFPFDWNITPIETVIQLIENDFEDFLSPHNLTYLSPTPRVLFKEEGTNLEFIDEMITPVICRKYRMLFPHDFSAGGELDLESVQSKYRNRIDRLRNLLSSDKKLTFVVQNGTLNDWQNEQYFAAFGSHLQNKADNWRDTLAAVLRKKYPHLQFDLLDFDEFQKLTTPLR